MKKAKLDIWEDIPDPEAEEQRAQIPLEQDSDIEDGSERRWAVNKLLLIGAPIALVVLFVCGFLAFYLIRNISSAPQTPTIISKALPEKAPQESPRTALPEVSGKDQAPAPHENTHIIYFKDFMIDLKDTRGNSYVLMCDIAFDLGEEQKNGQLEDQAVLRNIIYKTAQSRSVVALRSVEERKKLKTDLAFALDKILGDGRVKNVYFMNYFIM